jgi:hypothetical protein
VELLDRAVWRFLKEKRHLTASASLNTNWRTAIAGNSKASELELGIKAYSSLPAIQ